MFMVNGQNVQVILSSLYNTVLKFISNCFFGTILQSKEELLILQHFLYRVQANVDGIHIYQRLQNIGA